jgi:hypothetical protein
MVNKIYQSGFDMALLGKYVPLQNSHAQFRKGWVDGIKRRIAAVDNNDEAIDLLLRYPLVKFASNSDYLHLVKMVLSKEEITDDRPLHSVVKYVGGLKPDDVKGKVNFRKDLERRISNLA